jgi:diguanylate cyclase (GGDEF)-like protein
LFFYSPFCQDLYNKTADLLLRYRYAHASKPAHTDKIVIISCDEETFQKLKARRQVNRKDFVVLLKKMNARTNRPRTVGFDYSFRGKSERSQEDIAFADALKRSGNVVIASYFTPEGELLLPEEQFLRSARSAAFVNIPRDSDMIIRRVFSYVMLRDLSVHYSFAVQIFAFYKGIDLNQISLDVPKRETVLPAGGGSGVIRIPAGLDMGTTRVNYTCAPGDFEVVPFWSALKGARSNGFFKDKIVLLGSTREIDHDIHPTPFGLMPGVMISANFIVSLLNDRLLHEVPLWLNLMILLLTGIAVLWIVFAFKNVRAALCVAGLLAIGFMISVEAIRRDILFDLFGYVLMIAVAYGGANICRYMVVLMESNHLRHLAMTDALTGLYAFRYFELKLNMDLATARQDKAKLSLIICDIDNFKKLNDTYGHEAGNEVLRKTAALFAGNMKKTDTICRYGGEEFVVILPGAELANAVKVGDRIRKAVEAAVFPWNGQEIRITLSAGAAAFRSEAMTAQTLIEEADKALYMAKTSGKNKVCILP